MPKRERTERNIIYVLDFGGQYAHLLAQRIRKVGQVFTDIKCPDTPAAELADTAAAIVLSGGPQSVFDEASPKVDSAIFSLGIPILIICYGHQLMCQNLGGAVKEGLEGEYGRAELEVTDKSCPLLENMAAKSTVWMSHRDEVTELPAGFTVVGSTSTCKFAAISDEKRHLYGLQFHPEVVHSEEGEKLLANFVKLTAAGGTWNLSDFVETEVKNIQERTAGGKKVFLLCSGGVDSTVAYALLQKALSPDRVLGLFVDTGFMRMNERGEVENALGKAGFPNLHVRDASELFFSKLEGLIEPEKKRIAIGNTFLEVQREAVKDLKLDPSEWLLAQGTIYPDTIESGGTKNADKIKTHHNRVPEIDALIKAGLVIESLADLYKDEVRAVGEALGLAQSLVWRHPFPGPGLGVRLLCSDGLEILGDDEGSDATTIAGILKPHGCKGVVLPLRSVGVQGDARTYRHPAAISGDALRDWTLAGELSTKLTNASKEVNRVVLHLGGEGPAGLKTHRATCTPGRVTVLQKADKVAHMLLAEANLMAEVWQFPVVLAPLGHNDTDESVILRPVYSREAMTAEFARLPWDLVDRMTLEILKIDGVCSVFFDLTNKPPGTIEWE